MGDDKELGGGKMKGKEEIINLVDDTIHWLKILCLEDIEKDIQDKRAAIEIEHYYASILFSVTHTEEIVRKLNTLREDIAKEIREQKMQDKLEGKMKRKCVAPQLLCDYKSNDGNCGAEEQCVVVRKIKEEEEKNKERAKWKASRASKKFSGLEFSIEEK